MPADVDLSALAADSERMRRLGHDLVDRVVERWSSLRESPTGGKATRDEMEALLREAAPDVGMPVEDVLERFWRDVEPYAGRIDHPRFFAFIPSSPTFESVLGDWLATGCNIFQGTWIESAGPSQVEILVIEWLIEWLGLDPSTLGLLTSGGSSANLMGLAVAREDRLDGVPGRGTAYCSDQTHTAVDRALRILGFPPKQLRKLASGPGGVLDPIAVRDAVEQDRSEGWSPFCVIGSAGTTNTGAVDPLDELGALCKESDLWLHVDGAYGALARLTDRGARALTGLELADSLVLDPHKWLYVGYEAGCLLVRDGGRLRRTFHVFPDYLQDTQPGSGEVNFAEYGLQLTRSARALKLWVSLKANGRLAMRAAIDRTQDLAEYAARLVSADPVMELSSPACLGIVCFRYVGSPHLPDVVADRINESAVREIQRAGEFMFSSTRLGGRYVVRLCPLNYRTTEEDVRAAVEAVRVTAANLAGPE